MKDETKKQPKQYPESVRQSSLKRMQSDWRKAIEQSNKDLNLKPRDKK